MPSFGSYGELGPFAPFFCRPQNKTSIEFLSILVSFFRDHNLAVIEPSKTCEIDKYFWYHHASLEQYLTKLTSLLTILQTGATESFPVCG